MAEAKEIKRIVRTSPALKRATRPLKRFIRRLPFFKGDPQPPNLWQQRVWSIGIYTGKNPVELSAPKLSSNPVLTCRDVLDTPADLLADPFMLRVKDTWFMFFEVLNWETDRGQIGLAQSEDGLKWAYQQIVLAEPFHLSYPYVFEWLNNYYMIPESYQTASIRLYQAVNFPTHWSFVGTLLEGGIFLDSSIFRHDDKWWLFTETSPERKGDTLRLYYADDLPGPWLEHPHSPIISGDPHIARPAGRVLKVNERVIRYAQDCYPVYGTQVRAFEIVELTPQSYREQEVDKSPVLAASGAGWNGSGMHHVDAHLMKDGQWIACVDGWFINSNRQS